MFIFTANGENHAKTTKQQNQKDRADGRVFMIQVLVFTLVLHQVIIVLRQIYIQVLTEGKVK